MTAHARRKDPHTLDPNDEEIQRFLREAEVMVASAAGKRLVAKLNQRFQVRKGEETVYDGLSLQDAIEAYNNIP